MRRRPTCGCRGSRDGSPGRRGSRCGFAGSSARSASNRRVRRRPRRRTRRRHPDPLCERSTSARTASASLDRTAARNGSTSSCVKRPTRKSTSSSRARRMETSSAALRPMSGEAWGEPGGSPRLQEEEGTWGNHGPHEREPEASVAHAGSSCARGRSSLAPEASATPPRMSASPTSAAPLISSSRSTAPYTTAKPGIR